MDRDRGRGPGPGPWPWPWPWAEAGGGPGYTPTVPGFFADPQARRAYLITKAAVLVLLAGVTALLATRFGPRVWLGFAVFAVVLTALGLLVLIAGGRPDPAPHDETDAAADPDAAADAAADADAAPGRPVVLPVEDSLDLHPFAPADIPDVVWDYLDQAHASGFREVRVIHGRGIGVQRERVRSVLSRHPLVRSFADAPPERGGWGATVAILDEGAT